MKANRTAASGAVALVLLAAVWVGAATAQVDTGRHPDDERRTETGRLRRVETPGSGDRDWFVAAGAGFLASGDLFKVSVPSGNDLAWQPPAGGSFNSDRFTVTLDEDLQVALTGAWRATGRLWLRGDFSWARIQATALALVGQTGEVIPYDEFDVYLGALGTEYRLELGRTAPYVLGGVSWVAVRSTAEAGLDESHLGLRAGAGIQHALDARWSLRAEIRSTVIDFDLADYRPRAAGVAAPNIEFENLSPLLLWELFAAIHMRI